MMAASVPRLAARRERPSRALARALSTTALGRSSAQERAWAARIEARRQRLISAGEVIRPSPIDATPGSKTEPEVPISTASLWMSLPAQLCVFLMRLIRELRPRSCLELGTGFGISTAYQAASLELNGAGTLTTFEYAPEIAEIAGQGLSELGLTSRVEVNVGAIDDLLSEALEGIAPVEYAFVDADHTEEATIREFEAMLPHLAEEALVVFDDINWTEAGMTRAWDRIRRHGRVSAALPLRRLGVVAVCQK
jgi:predicted O-methyltransferase YrrM